MSCNGCRVLRKGCSKNCILRPCLQWIDSAEAQGHATVFVAKFFGRAGLMSFISSVPESQSPALFRSLLYEACGRTVNPVNGAVGLLSTGNWHICQRAVETVLRGGSLRPIPELLPRGGGFTSPASDKVSENIYHHCRFSDNRKRLASEQKRLMETHRQGTPSRYSEESVTTTSFQDNAIGERFVRGGGETKKLLNLFT